jgi:hypothetical protein
VPVPGFEAVELGEDVPVGGSVADVPVLVAVAVGVGV